MSRKLERRMNLAGLAIAIAAAAVLSLRPVDDSQYDASSRLKVHDVDTLEGRRLIESGAVVIDVRPSEAFDERHIAGALNIPLARLRAMLPESPAVDRAQPIVVYCGDGAATGPEGTATMTDAGFTGAVNLRGGLDAWRKAGLPTEKSEA